MNQMRILFTVMDERWKSLWGIWWHHCVKHFYFLSGGESSLYLLDMSEFRSWLNSFITLQGCGFLSVCLCSQPRQNHHECVPLRQTTVWCFRSVGALCWSKIKAWKTSVVVFDFPFSLHLKWSVSLSGTGVHIYILRDTFNLLSYCCIWQNITVQCENTADCELLHSV